MGNIMSRLCGAPSNTCHDAESTQEEMQKRSLKPGVDGASSSGGHQAESTQEDIERISDHLYTFHVPESATLDILLFHGLECERAHVPDAHILTWRSTAETEAKEEIWPQKWLPEDFPHARIISVGYDGCSKKTDREGGMDLFLIGENLVQDILLAREHCSDRPVILVGHGFGGVVLKKLCVHAQEKKEKPVNGKDMDTFLESIRGFFFYSTPHLGVEGMEPPAANEGPLLRWMRVLNSESARLHEAFSEMWMARRYNWTIYGLGEVQSTLRQHGLRVPEGSTRFGDVYITVQEDHFFVCRPSGKNDNRYQYLHSLIERVQRQVELERKPPLMVPEVTVGVDGLLTEILGKRIRDHKFVGFFGMGGVGKTTLAKLIFNKIFATFEFSCFVEEIKQIPGTKDEVKEKVWKKMLRHGAPVRSASGSSGADEWYQVTGRSLLVVFDDVQDTDHVKLLKEIAHDNGMRESRFIVTGQDRSLLRDCAQDIHICELDKLEDVDANKLFITYAFPGQQEPPESLRPVVKQVVDGCEGLPLTLEVLGMYLRDKQEIDQWEEIPTALRECNKIADLDQKVWAKLQLSYDRLPENEVKYMFLDIASFFIFKEVSDRFPLDAAISAWTSVYGIGRNRLQTLEDRALVRIITIGEDGYDIREFYMHEHLRKMGQRIAKMEGRSFDLSRVRTLWTSDADPEENAHNQYPPDDQIIFQGDQELGKIVAHRVSITENSMLVCKQTCVFCIMREVWPKLTAIRYLDLNVEVSDCCQECKNRGCPLPNTLVLFFLEFHNKGDFVISGGIGTNFPLVLTGCTSLVSMGLSKCNNVDLGGLNRLQHLQLLVIEGCGGIRNWPTSLRELTNLKRLGLSHIQNPFELPITLGNLINLEFLCITDCKIASVPSSLQNLTKLRMLVVKRVIGTEAIPNVIGFLRRLEILQLECCGIDNLLDGLRELTALRELSLTCEGITELPDTLGNLTFLETLKLTCHISCLPASVSNLMRLKMLSLEGRFGTVRNTQDLLYVGRFGTVTQDSLVVRLTENEILCPIDPLFDPLQGFMTKQKGLDLGCQLGPSAIVVRNMIGLESLAIDVRGLEAVPDIFGHLQKLRIFLLTCGAMEKNLVESLKRLSSLEVLELACRTVEQLPDVFGCFSTLKTLRIECPLLQALPDSLGNFIQLTEFHLTGCNSLTTFGRCSSSLVRLRLGAWEISRVQPRILLQLPRLKEFEICGLYRSEHSLDPVNSHPGDHLQPLPEAIWKISHLESLLLENLPLTTLPKAIENLASLQKLRLLGCAIESLPESLGNLSSLTYLVIVSCRALHSLPESLGRLSSLTKLNLRGCTSLKTLPETIGGLSSLRLLDVSGSGLQSLPNTIGGLSNLENLFVLSCKNLKLSLDRIVELLPGTRIRS